MESRTCGIVPDWIGAAWELTLFRLTPGGGPDGSAENQRGLLHDYSHLADHGGDAASARDICAGSGRFPAQGRAGLSQYARLSAVVAGGDDQSTEPGALAGF